MNAATQKPLLVVGAGIAGISAALEAAEAGQEVVLVERGPAIGGQVVQNLHYFPKLCPPTCGMEINIRRLERNPRVRVITGAQVTKASRSGDGWSITLTHAPRHVNSRCTACDECSQVCPAKVPDPHNLLMLEVTAIRLPHADAWPRYYTMDRNACPAGCTKCAEACQFNAINLDATEQTEELEFSAVILATGWQPYPIEKLEELGGGKIPDVIANVQMERLASPTGPTGGKIHKPSDGRPPKRVAFVQCAGSRDVKHLPYCSAVCCLASLKQAIYVREQLPESEVTIYYIDRRAPGRNEDMLTKVAGMDCVKLTKGKVGKIEKGAQGLTLRVEDVESGKLTDAAADLAVLATGMMSSLKDAGLPFDIEKDDDGFGLDNPQAGLFVAGVARRPEDVAASVRDATGVAAKAIAASKSSPQGAGRRA